MKELFALYEIRYRKSYRQKVNRSMNFRVRKVLMNEKVEGHVGARAAYRKDLLAFKGKVDRKIESTRGMFISDSRLR